MKNITSKYSSQKSFVLLILVMLFAWMPAAAQEAAAAPSIEASGEEQFIKYVLYTFFGLFIAILLLFISTINSLLKAVVETQLIQAAAESPEAAKKWKEIAERPSAWKKFMQRMTDSKPIEQEHDIMLDHDYDGIKELDNHLPPWWKWGFYFTIVYAVIYLVNYHIVPIYNSGHTQEQELEKANQEAELAIAEYRKTAADLVDENNVVLLTEAVDLEKGKSKFGELCAACHGDAGQGGIGPNLTDQYWLHGGDIKSVFTTIKYGVPDKGMISWKDEVKPSEMQALASYILSLQGTNPDGAKEPQGELFKANTDSLSTDSITNPVVNSTSTAGI